MERIKKIKDKIKEHQADAAYLTFLPDICWACGFTGSNGILIVLPDEAHFVTDGRYRSQAHREVEGAEIHIPGYDLTGHVKEAGLLGEAASVIFQAEHLTVSELNKLRDQFPEMTWKPVEGLLQKDVASKEASEIDKIRRAQAITDAVFEDLLDLLMPGISEREIAAEIIYQHLKRGASKVSFDPIVASGPNSSLPHARPSSRKLQHGDLVTIDMGGLYEGYASDMTRTVSLGEPDEEKRRVYETVLRAQEEAIAAARAGMNGKELDGVARAVIEDAGYGEYFSHGLGHGLGLQVHEWPRLSYHVAHELPPRAVVTIEPGIYLPEQYGVRIEDIVVLGENGTENLTGAPKELIVL